MSSLNLPKPKQVFAGEDELRKLNGGGPNGAANGNGTPEVEVVEEYRPPRGSDKYKLNMIFPPREIRGEFRVSPRFISLLVVGSC